jgi:hypothetical protein
MKAYCTAHACCGGYAVGDAASEDAPPPPAAAHSAIAARRLWLGVSRACGSARLVHGERPLRCSQRAMALRSAEAEAEMQTHTGRQKMTDAAAARMDAFASLLLPLPLLWRTVRVPIGGNHRVAHHRLRRRRRYAVRAKKTQNAHRKKRMHVRV